MVAGGSVMAAQTLPGTLTAFSDAHRQTHPHSDTHRQTHPHSDTHMPALAVILTLTHSLPDRQVSNQ